MKVEKILTYCAPKSIARTGYMPEAFYKFTEKSSIKFEFASRKAIHNLMWCFINLMKMANKIRCRFSSGAVPMLDIDTNAIKNIDTQSEGYMKLLYALQRKMCEEKEVEINVENNEINNIVDSKESCIFVMNHDKQKQDPKLLNFFNALLSREYINRGKSKECPRPRIILNKDILDSSNEIIRSVAEKWGAVGVDASIHCTNQVYNGRVIAKLIKELVQDKINLFIFPEGRMCAFRNMSPDWKFQTGIANIIRTLASKKERVKVVPLGFAYKNDTGGIHVGEPVYFRQKGDSMMFSGGTVKHDYQSKAFTEFMEQSPSIDGYHTITENGEPVDIRKSGEYIAGILCENLTACKKMAQDSIKNVGTVRDSDTIYTIEDIFEG